MWVPYLWLIILSVGDDVSVDRETLLVTDFVNLKIKPVQFFRCAHRNMTYMRVFIGVSDYMCISIYVCTVLLKNLALLRCLC
jgi:hypothetical protein